MFFIGFFCIEYKEFKNALHNKDQQQPDLKLSCLRDHFEELMSAMTEGSFLPEMGDTDFLCGISRFSGINTTNASVTGISRIVGGKESIPSQS